MPRVLTHLRATIRARVRLYAMRSVESPTERYVRLRDALQVAADCFGDEASLGDAIEALDDEYANQRSA